MFHTTLPLTSTSLTISSTYSWQKRSLRWTSLKRKIMEVIEEDQLECTNNERLSWAKPHSGQKPKNENDLWQKTTLDAVKDESLGLVSVSRLKVPRLSVSYKILELVSSRMKNFETVSSRLLPFYSVSSRSRPDQDLQFSKKLSQIVKLFLN